MHLAPRILLYTSLVAMLGNLVSILIAWVRTIRRPAPGNDVHSGGSECSRRVLILGATGGTGRQLVAQALARGHHVTALARRPERLPLQHSNLRVLRGDVRDPAAVEAAVAGQDAVLSALGHRRWLVPVRVLSEGTGHVVRAMEKRGVRRLVCMTSLGVGESWWRMGVYFTLLVIPFVLPFYFWDKRRQEAVIRASRLEWTIVRPGVLTDGPARGDYRAGSRIGNPLWTVRISRADVAAFMLDQLETTRYLRAAPALAW